MNLLCMGWLSEYKTERLNIGLQKKPTENFHNFELGHTALFSLMSIILHFKKMQTKVKKTFFAAYVSKAKYTHLRRFFEQAWRVNHFYQ